MMIKLKTLRIIIIVFIFSSCATSMSPIEVNNTLPALTKSKLISQAQAEENSKTNACRYLVRNRNYVAEIGISTKQDLSNAARGIDEWVKLDGGNAYVLKNYKWVTVDDKGSTQLHVDFDTMLCE